MSDLLSSYYLWVKALHVMAVISWMAGLFYLPRLYVYHVEGLQKAGVTRGSDMDLLFRHQEWLLLKAIMTPAMYATWIFGLMLVFTPGIVGWSEIWPWAKGSAVILMTVFHYWLGAQRIALAEGRNRLTGRQYRMANEFPTVLMIVIVLGVIVRF
ncbi:MAG: CopD family protein [Rhodobacteraceae bacterium]|nr:CopD family protein [Paracoccaceae bacterium]